MTHMRIRNVLQSMRAVILIGALAAVALSMAAVPGRAQGHALSTDPRLAARVTLDGTGRTVQQVLNDLNPQLRGVRLRVAPTLLGEFAAVWTADRPASEILEALAWAVHGEWRPVPGGLRLQYVEALPQATQPVVELDLNQDAALQPALTWPPVPVERKGREMPRRAVENDYHPRSLGGALTAAAIERSLSLVVVTPALRRSPNYSGNLGERATVTGRILFREMAALEGGSWQRTGATYTLRLPSAAVKLRQRPREELFQSLRQPMEHFYASLTPRQRELLRPGGMLSGKGLTDVQKGLIARYAELHHAYAPIYHRRLVEDRNGFYIKGTESSVETGLGMGERPLAEIERRDFEKLPQSKLEP